MISVQNILAGEFKSSEWTNHVAVISQCQFHSVNFTVKFVLAEIKTFFFEAMRLSTYSIGENLPVQKE